MKSNHIIAILFALVWISLGLDNLIVFGFAVSCLSFLLLHRMSAKMNILKFSTRLAKKLFVVKNPASAKKANARLFPIPDNISMSISKPILQLAFFQKFQKKLASQMESGIMTSGIPANPLALIKKSMSFSIVLSFGIIPVAISLGIVVNPLFLAIMTIPGMILFYPLISLKTTKSKRETVIKHELAYFVKYAAIMQSVEKSLYESLVETIGKNLFEVIENDAKLVYRNVTMFAMDTFTALNQIALNHPNRLFQSFLLSYVATAQTGGDLTNLVERESESFFETLKESLKRYIDVATHLGEVLLIMNFILPLFLVATSFLLPGGSISILLIVGVIGIPLMSMGLIAMTDSAQPRNLNYITMNKMSFVAGIATSLVMLAASQPPWLIVTSGVLGFAVLNMLHTGPQFLRIKNTENALPEFLRDMTEYRKIGYDMTISVFQLFSRRKYNKHFDELFARIYIQLKSGSSLSQIAETENKSWTTKMVLFILGKLADTGGGTPLTMEHLTRFVTDINTTKNTTLSALRMQLIFVYMAPPLMVFVAKMSSSMLAKMTHNFSMFGGIGINNVFEITPQFVDVTGLVIAIASLSMGFVFAKISLFTLKDTRNVVIVAIILIISNLLSPYFPTIF